ncbi:AAA family ATPase [Methanobrevibacter olleyae]|uniref:Archaeal ATPase n=1 Tax=Methanobrevibacter olleyae TaxID=294671 RepID=A0A126R219_METOL|nr:ATP-binding protein [Methanobrevibacter olleyae]AMK16147.1 archaeal ATPase [Methanobrevibacter olleyae]SFL31996.1 hypothetical protein SAMN02910297_00560 [Methanobrevibacter olleyae]
MSKLPWGNSKVLTDEEFFNREQEINNLKNLLSSTGENNAPDILLTGIRGVGKTVLLNRIKNIMDDDYLVIYMDFTISSVYQKNQMSVKGLLDYYFQEIISECRDKGLKSLDSQIKKFFKTNNFKLEKFLNINGIPIPLISTERDIEKYRDFVFKLAEDIYKENQDKIKGIIIIIDEFQVIKEIGDYLNSFLWNFRGYVTSQRNVAYVLSGSMSLQDNLISEIAGQNGAFGGRMLTININPFTKETANTYLKEKAPELNFTEEGFDRFYKCTSGIPSYINIFARQLDTSTTLNEEEVINAFDNNLSLILSHLINEWNRLTIKEKDIIITLIHEPLKRIEIARKLNVKSGSLSNKLNKLQNLGLIKFIDGKYEINEHLLKRWLKLEHEQKGIYPYRVI